ncbi:MAG TPA: endonuclease/exonuclease/phosphatase family protein [Gemmataceae bacterium]|nr:endonuclease/exonuclease/phosphatase family protein [Gemmataceae bacterium]
MNRCSWIYAGAVLAVLFILRLAGDRWWLVTVLMFGPRWPYALPLSILIPLALFVGRRSLWPLAISLAVVIGPLMGLCLPWRPLIAPKSLGPRTRVLTCNVHYNQLDAAALSMLITQTEPDIVALQGWIGKHKPVMFWEENWHLRRDGELCLGTRYPIRKVELATDAVFQIGRGAFARYDLEAPNGTIHFFNLHLASPREGLKAVISQPAAAPALLQANSDLRRSQTEILRRWTEELEGRIMLTGDFNTPPDSTIYADFWSPFHNAFAEAGFGWGNTYFSRRAAVRIDHQLAGPGWQCRTCWVGPNVGSPHRPVIADWAWLDPND